MKQNELASRVACDAGGVVACLNPLTPQRQPTFQKGAFRYASLFMLIPVSYASELARSGCRISSPAEWQSGKEAQGCVAIQLAKKDQCHVNQCHVTPSQGRPTSARSNAGRAIGASAHQNASCHEYEDLFSVFSGVRVPNQPCIKAALAPLVIGWTAPTDRWARDASHFTG